MESLKLGLIGLSEAEKRLVDTLFRLHSVEPSFIWTIASEGPFDALLVDESVNAVSYEDVREARTQVMRLGGIHAIADEGLMPRPIRSDILNAWLNRSEVVILHQGQDAFSSTLHHSQQVHSPVVSQSSATPAAEAVAQPETPSTELDSLSFKLKRWPSEALHKRDSATIRMASMLTRRTMTIAELSEASGQPLLTCRVLVQMFRLQNLLIETPVPRVVSPQPMQAAQSEAHKPRLRQQRKGRFGGALIKSIRQRFGIS